MKKLQEFGLEWFRYLDPPSKILINLENNADLFRKFKELSVAARYNNMDTINFLNFVTALSALPINFTKVNSMQRNVIF